MPSNVGSNNCTVKPGNNERRRKAKKTCNKEDFYCLYQTKWPDGWDLLPCV